MRILAHLAGFNFDPEVRKKGTAFFLFEKTVKSYIKKKDFRIFVFANYYSSLLTANREIQVKIKKNKSIIVKQKITGNFEEVFLYEYLYN